MSEVRIDEIDHVPTQVLFPNNLTNNVKVNGPTSVTVSVQINQMTAGLPVSILLYIAGTKTLIRPDNGFITYPPLIFSNDKGLATFQFNATNGLGSGGPGQFDDIEVLAYTGAPVKNGIFSIFRVYLSTSNVPQVDPCPKNMPPCKNAPTGP